MSILCHTIWCLKLKTSKIPGNYPCDVQGEVSHCRNLLKSISYITLDLTPPPPYVTDDNTGPDPPSPLGRYVICARPQGGSTSSWAISVWENVLFPPGCFALLAMVLNMFLSDLVLFLKKDLSIVIGNWSHVLRDFCCICRTGLTWKDQNLGRKVEVKCMNKPCNAWPCNNPYMVININILWRASEAGSPTNHPGSDKKRGQGSFGPSTGEPDLQGSLKLDNYLDIKI